MEEDNNISDDNSDWDGKDETNLPYRFVNHDFKMAYVLRRMEDLEREHFALMVDRLDSNHKEYENWYNAVIEVKQEMSRLEYIYRQLGGTFGSEIPGMGS